MIQNLAWRGYSIVTIDEIFLLLLFTFNLFIIDIIYYWHLQKRLPQICDANKTMYFNARILSLTTEITGTS